MYSLLKKSLSLTLLLSMFAIPNCGAINEVSKSSLKSPAHEKRKISMQSPSLIAAEPFDVVNEVNLFIGTGAHGHTFPGATVPFGMVQLSPDTRRETWDGCSGYLYTDTSILGFSHTHLSGTGCGDLGDISFMPTTKAIDKNAEFDFNKFASPYTHKEESASPGYYSVKLGQIKAELTSSKRVGFHKYTFPKGKDSKIAIDLTQGISDKPLELNLRIVDDRTVVGMRRSQGWAKNQYVYFAAKFSQPFSSYGTAKDNDKPLASSTGAQGKRVSGWLEFDTTNGEPVLAKVALSSVSSESAMKNLEQEIPHWDFEKTRKEATDSWRTALSKIKINTSDDNKRKTFYSSLYHSFCAPTIVSDVDGSYRGSDSLPHKAEGFENYSTFSLWDTFRAEHSLLSIIETERVNDLVKSMLAQAQYHEKHLLPIWTLASNETYCMIGYHSFPVIAEAYAKGIRNWDADATFKFMLANAKANDPWAERGYIAADKEEESVSKTLEFAYDDWCLAEFAKALGHNEEAAKFQKRGQAFKNVFDFQSGFMRGRLANGSWRTPFDPKAVVGGGPLRDFTEANAWQYTFFIPQDVPAMIDLYGGDKKFIKKLDEMFTTPLTGELGFNDVSGLIGQYAQGNEPSHHVAYLYSYAGAPEKTAERVKAIRDSMYTNAPEGLCGNEDCGQMSAWYVFSALGFYPVNPVSCNYVIGTPQFSKSAIKLPNGKTFNVVAPGLSEKAIYVQKASLNGKPLNQVFVSHKDIMNGGTLELTMSDKPGSWGSK